MSKDKEPPEKFDGTTFIDCDFSNNGKGGAKLGSGKYKFINSSTNDNGGDGIELGDGASASFENHESKRNKGYAIRTLAEAIKKPLANGKLGLKIIVGSILVPIIVGIAVHEYGLWRKQIDTSKTQQESQVERESTRENTPKIK